MVELIQLMKGGKDMKKIFKYKIDNDNFIINAENGKNVLKISKNNLVLNGNDFYEGLFKNYKKGDKIEVIKENEDIEEKLYHSVFEVLTELINNIELEINKLD